MTQVILLYAGLSVNSKTRKGTNALQFAAKHGTDFTLRKKQPLKSSLLSETLTLHNSGASHSVVPLMPVQSCS